MLYKNEMHPHGLCHRGARRLGNGFSRRRPKRFGDKVKVEGMA
jgi:hypothetical protein